MGMTFHRHSKKIRKTKRWEALRLLALRRDHYKCLQCSARGRLEVDHIQPVRTHPHLAFVLDNLQSLCPTCHTYKTRVECGFPEVSNQRRQWRLLVSNHTTPIQPTE
jgi:5-methylcytosine-specific restriction endonuclease McrA